MKAESGGQPGEACLECLASASRRQWSRHYESRPLESAMRSRSIMLRLRQHVVEARQQAAMHDAITTAGEATDVIRNIDHDAFRHVSWPKSPSDADAWLSWKASIIASISPHWSNDWIIKAISISSEQVTFAISHFMKASRRRLITIWRPSTDKYYNEYYHRNMWLWSCICFSDNLMALLSRADVDFEAWGGDRRADGMRKQILIM